MQGIQIFTRNVIIVYLPNRTPSIIFFLIWLMHLLYMNYFEGLGPNSGSKAVPGFEIITQSVASLKGAFHLETH